MKYAMQPRKGLLCLGLALLSILPALAQEPVKKESPAGKMPEETVYIKAGKLIQCQVRLPKNFTPRKRYTLLIGLHGNGGSAEGFIRLWGLFKNPSFIFAAPEGPYPLYLDGQGKNGSFSWEIRTEDQDLWKRGDPLSIDYIVETARFLKERYPVDKIYLMGFSQGAAYAYIAGIKNPGVFAGIISLSGPLPPEDQSYSIYSAEDFKAARGLPVFIAQGRQDPAVKYQTGVKAKEKLEKYGFQVTFFSFDGVHTVLPEVLAQVQSWLK